VRVPKWIWYWIWDPKHLGRAKLVHELGAWSEEREKRKRGAGIVVKNPEIKDFH
jgi:hypothetical protein